MLKETVVNTENPVPLKWTAERKDQQTLSPFAICTPAAHDLCLLLCTVLRRTQPAGHKAAGPDEELGSSESDCRQAGSSHLTLSHKLAIARGQCAFIKTLCHGVRHI